MKNQLLIDTMKRSGDTQADLAKALGIAPRTLSRKINGFGPDFTLDQINQIKERYHLTPEEASRIFFHEELTPAAPADEVEAMKAELEELRRDKEQRDREEARIQAKRDADPFTRMTFIIRKEYLAEIRRYSLEHEQTAKETLDQILREFFSK